MKPKAQAISTAPRIIRFRDAPAYLGMDRNRFNAEVRPFLTEVPIGTQGIGFDRLELDAWVDDYIARNGRPAWKGKSTWDANHRRASSSVMGSGTSTRKSAGGAFARALEQVAPRKRSDISRVSSST
jgi:predicted DNA-binding transcriptional regulator AlpA